MIVLLMKLTKSQKTALVMLWVYPNGHVNNVTRGNLYDKKLVDLYGHLTNRGSHIAVDLIQKEHSQICPVCFSDLPDNYKIREARK